MDGKSMGVLASSPHFQWHDNLSQLYGPVALQPQDADWGSREATAPSSGRRAGTLGLPRVFPSSRQPGRLSESRPHPVSREGALKHGIPRLLENVSIPKGAVCGPETMDYSTHCS